MATGALLVIAGAWVLLRTVRKPDGGRSLVDVILGAGDGAAPAAPAGDAAGGDFATGGGFGGGDFGPVRPRHARPGVVMRPPVAPDGHGGSRPT